jgi:hypothetical protein
VLELMSKNGIKKGRTEKNEVLIAVRPNSRALRLPFANYVENENECSLATLNVGIWEDV